MNKVKVVNDCTITMYKAAGPGRNSPARYVVHSRRNGMMLGTLEHYRGAGMPWQACAADGSNRGSWYGRDGLRAAVAALSGTLDD